MTTKKSIVVTVSAAAAVIRVLCAGGRAEVAYAQAIFISPISLRCYTTALPYFFSTHC